MVRKRLKVLTVLLALPFLAVVARLAWLQLVPSSYEACFRLSQHRLAILLPPRRGRILARDGRILAGNHPVHDLRFRYPYLNPRRIPLSLLVNEIKRTFPALEVEEVERRLLS